MSKALLVTYNQIPNIPIGRHEIGNVIICSGDYGKDSYLLPAEAQMDRRIEMLFSQEARDKYNAKRQEQSEKAEATLRNTSTMIDNGDIDQVSTVFIYVGKYAMQGAMNLARSFVKTGKKIVLFACDCEEDTKQSFAKEIGCEIMVSGDCGGRKMARAIIDEWNKNFPTAE